MKRYCNFILFLFCTIIVNGQSSDANNQKNIVPNPGFESYASSPIGWFLKGDHFTKVMKYWVSPTGASPDVFGPRVRVPSHWAEKGFGQQTPHGGKSMVGITVYGCDGGKPHCREYLLIHLSEPLVKGQKYYAAFQAAQLPRGMRTNKLAMYFSQKEYDIQTDELIEAKPQVEAMNIVESTSGWVKIGGSFTASEEAEFLIIGNFTPDQDCSIKQGYFPPLEFGYYYIDDVVVKKQEPILHVPLRADDLSNITIEEGKIVPLKHIYFEHDKSELLPRSFVELNKLYNLFIANPSMVIEIVGHTDNTGEDGYNMQLSMNRAEAVVSFLISKGIQPYRALFKGYGRTRPIASNLTADGRQQNRRVEFIIIKK